MANPDFLTTARYLLQGTSEADWRSAISRAYYAAFHVLRSTLVSNLSNAQLNKLGKRKRRRWEIGHHRIPKCLKRCSDAQVSRIGEDINDFLSYRTDADYYMDTTMIQSRANDIVDDIDRLIQEITTIDVSNLVAEVSTVLQTWL